MIGRWLLLIFLITGIGNYYFKFQSWNVSILNSYYGKLLLFKLFLFCLMVLINFYHEHKVGMKMLLNMADEEYESLKKRASITGRMTLFLSLLIAFIGMYLAK